MLSFCTLFDSNYISKGIALYLSLEKVSSDFHLYVMAFDSNCFEQLKRLPFSNITVELWDDWETNEIKAVKGDRNRAEYCWTCGPSVIYHFLTYYKLPDITYLDSDLFFVADPMIAFSEIGSSSIAITEQGISEINEKKYGKYCVQFMFFRNDINGVKALKWWRDSCIEWCYQRFEDGKYGDQKYLDSFPEKFDNVYIIKNPGVGVAPWNMYRYKYCNEGMSIIKDKVSYPMVFFHMHGLKGEIQMDKLFLKSSDSIIYDEVNKLFFLKYADLLKSVYNDVLGIKISEVTIRGIPKWRRFELYLRGILNKSVFLRRIYSHIWGVTEHDCGIQ